MRIATIILTLASTIGVALPQPAQASEFDKKTIVTFNQPMEIPGRTLPAGEYVIKRADRALPDVVRFTSADEDQIYATVFALPTYRSEPTSDVVIITEERRAGSPEAIKKWFYPGDIVGAEFVYPKSSGMLMAMATTPSMDTAPASRPSDVKSEPVAPAEPLMTQNEEPAKVESQPQEPVEIAQATPQNEPARTQAQPAQREAMLEEEQAASQEELPRTASSLPMASFWGGLAILGGAILRRFSRRKA